MVGAANIQIATCSPNFLILESIQQWGGIHAQLLKNPIRWEQGYVIPPTAPGLGVELDEAVALANRLRRGQPAASGNDRSAAGITGRQLALRLHRTRDLWAGIWRPIWPAAASRSGVFDLQRSAADAVLAAGAHWADSVSELARLMRLPDHLSALAGSHRGGFEARRCRRLRRGSTWIEMSTNDFAEIEALAARAAALGIATLACPVTGGVHRAEAGDITVLVGGAQQVFAMHEPALKAMGGRVIHLGGIEQAAVTKVVTNMLAFIHLIAAGEALMLCAKAGVDLRAAYRGDRRQFRQQLRA